MKRDPSPLVDLSAFQGGAVRPIGRGGIPPRVRVLADSRSEPGRALQRSADLFLLTSPGFRIIFRFHNMT